MAHDHDHSKHAHTADGERRMRWNLLITAAFFLVELIAGFLTGSLALLSDAAHMATDVMALGIALAAIHLGRRPADARRTYGYRRFEILAAAVNAAGLLVISVFILLEAWRRFQNPETVDTSGMLLVAFLGLVVNLIAVQLLHAGAAHSLNMRGAYLEVLSDLVGSALVIVAALVIRYTGWEGIDPLVAVAIGLWVLPRGWALLSESVNILLEGVPRGVALNELRSDLAALPNVAEVHDLHLWAITSGQASLTAHLRVADWPRDGALLEAARAVARKHGVDHTNFQIERDACSENGADCVLHLPQDAHDSTHSAHRH